MGHSSKLKNWTTVHQKDLENEVCASSDTSLTFIPYRNKASGVRLLMLDGKLENFAHMWRKKQEWHLNFRVLEMLTNDLTRLNYTVHMVLIRFFKFLNL